MIDRIIFYILIGLTVYIARYYLTKATGKKVTANNGEYLLRMNKLYYYIGVVAMAIAVIIVVVPPLVDTPDITMLITIFIMLLLFGGLGLLCILYYRNYYVLFDSTRIEVRNLLGKTRTIQWNDIQLPKVF